jgi:hypothetical protein
MRRSERRAGDGNKERRARGQGLHRRRQGAAQLAGRGGDGGADDTRESMWLCAERTAQVEEEGIKQRIRLAHFSVAWSVGSRASGKVPGQGT